MTVEYFDNHCHLTERLHGGVEAALDAARAVGVRGFITVGCDRATSEEAIAVADRHDDVWATVGLHPHDSVHGADSIADLITAPKVLAVGECGLDYYYDHSPRDVQRAAFAAQIQLAKTAGLPLVVHTRDAWSDTFDVLAAEGIPDTVIFHCFTGGPDEARACLDLGAYLSYSGIVTFKTADDLRAAARLTPLDRLLAETDSPYLAPVPHRGKQNAPSLVSVVVEALADTLDADVATVAEATVRNSVIAFRVPTT